MPAVQFYFDYRSPYSYLAQSQLGDLALEIHPFDVLDVMKRVNNTPTTITCAAKNRYAGADLGRWAARYGIPFAPNPQMRTLDGRRLLRATLAVKQGVERQRPLPHHSMRCGACRRRSVQSMRWPRYSRRPV
jgi:2-hydroxychromene-2-carboxylate isomerase